MGLGPPASIAAYVSDAAFSPAQPTSTGVAAPAAFFLLVNANSQPPSPQAPAWVARLHAGTGAPEWTAPLPCRVPFDGLAIDEERGRVLVTCANAATAGVAGKVLSLDAASGAVVWAGGPATDNMASGPSLSQARGVVVYGETGGSLVALDAGTGAEVASAALSGEMRGMALCSLGLYCIIVPPRRRRATHPMVHPKRLPRLLLPPDTGLWQRRVCRGGAGRPRVEGCGACAAAAAAAAFCLSTAAATAL